MTKSYALELQGDKNIPLELNLIVKNLNYYEDNFIQKQISTLKSIDFLSRQLSVEVFFINTKLEIYKSLLKNDSPLSRKRLDGTSMSRLKVAISKSKNEFMVWFLTALLKDTETLINSNEYKEYLLTNTASTSSNSKKSEHRRIEKKMQLLNYWIEKINPEADDYPDNLKKILAVKLVYILNNLNTSLQFIAREMRLPIVVPPDWQFKSFSEKKSSSSQAQPSKPVIRPEGKSIEDILAPVTDDSKTELPLPTEENWLEDENLPDSLKNLPKPSNDAEWLEDF
jgi:hypothetical protein